MLECDQRSDQKGQPTRPPALFAFRRLLLLCFAAGQRNTFLYHAGGGGGGGEHSEGAGQRVGVECGKIGVCQRQSSPRGCQGQQSAVGPEGRKKRPGQVLRGPLVVPCRSSNLMINFADDIDA